MTTGRKTYRAPRVAACCPECQARVTVSAAATTAACPFCGAGLQLSPQGSPARPPATGMRDALELAREHAEVMARSMQAREQEAVVREEARRRITEQLRAAGRLPAEAEVVVVPAFDRPLAPLSAERRQKFVQHITEVAQQALDQLEPGTHLPNAELASSAQESSAEVRQAACRTCRGACCANGGEHGYLLPSSLLRWLPVEGMGTVAQVVDLYRAFLPDQSHAHSCVFHTEQGCTIPREYRSNTCNAFVCQGLAEYESRPQQSGGEVVIVAGQHGEAIRLELVPLKF